MLYTLRGSDSTQTELKSSRTANFVISNFKLWDLTTVDLIPFAVEQ